MSYPGELGPGDTRLGRYFDTYPLQLTTGDRIVVTLSSYDFDAYLRIESPDGTEMENDDYDDGSDARLDVLVDTTGTWKIRPPITVMNMNNAMTDRSIPSPCIQAGTRA